MRKSYNLSAYSPPKKSEFLRHPPETPFRFLPLTAYRLEGITSKGGVDAGKLMITPHYRAAISIFSPQRKNNGVDDGTRTRGLLGHNQAL